MGSGKKGEGKEGKTGKQGGKKEKPSKATWPLAVGRRLLPLSDKAGADERPRGRLTDPAMSGPQPLVGHGGLADDHQGGMQERDACCVKRLRRHPRAVLRPRLSYSVFCLEGCSLSFISTNFPLP